jgi:hypothetical protein
MLEVPDDSVDAVDDVDSEDAVSSSSFLRAQALKCYKCNLRFMDERSMRGHTARCK